MEYHNRGALYHGRNQSICALTVRLNDITEKQANVTFVNMFNSALVGNGAHKILKLWTGTVIENGRPTTWEDDQRHMPQVQFCVYEERRERLHRQ